MMKTISEDGGEKKKRKKDREAEEATHVISLP